MGFMAAILGAAASASSSVATETMQASEEAIRYAAESGFASRAQEAAAAEMADDTMDIKNAVLNNSSNNEPKNFFSRAWDESKQSLGIGGNGTDMGKIGYNAAKMAVAKGDSSEPQRMDPAPVQASAPSVPAANAEDELNRLRNRMNVS